ncbi:hypothetical protein [Lactobacillus crispatus]|uniref:hypothetical protein n=1 Tax=Lactobacillus crispatus TaxID=47770 RepID=UPI003369F277
MKLWNRFLNTLYLVDKPISLALSNKIALLIAIVCMLLAGAFSELPAYIKSFLGIKKAL